MSSVRRDGRVLALGTDRGVALWDLARGTELAFLPIGQAWHAAVRGIGRLAHQRVARRAAVAGSARSGPRGIPHRPAHVSSRCRRDWGIAEDRAGRIVAMAYGDHALVATPERTIRVGPLDDCRYVAVSPDGQWLATGSHGMNGAQVWRIRDAARVADLQVEGLVGVVFSPDGKWLMTSPSPCRLWAVGTWREAGQRIGGDGARLFPRRPIWWSSGREQGPSPGRDRDGPHGRPAREPGLVRRAAGRHSAPTGRAWS